VYFDALAASIVRAILIFWFEKEEGKLTGQKGADVLSHNKMSYAMRSALIDCAKETT